MMRIALLLLAFAGTLILAAPARAELDGPLSIVDRSQPSSISVNGYLVTVYPAVPGVHMICSAAFYAAHAAALAPYRDAVQTNLEAVYAGDDPAHPTTTVALTFPDQATANLVKLQLLGLGG